MEKKKGRIISSVGGLYTVRVFEDGSYSEYACQARGIFRHSNIKLVVGDVATIDFSEGDPVIEAIEDRRNSLIRPPLANLDTIFVTMAAKSPAPMLDMTDKLTAILEHNDIEPVIVIGKCELDEVIADKIKATYESAGYKVFKLSCITGEGVDEIKEYINSSLSGKIAAFAGASGVGKSTLLNNLFPELELGTGGVSRKTERGKHTTRAVTLYPIGEDAYLADTPGFSMLDFDRFDFFSLDDLPLAFREINERIGQCKYTKCTHRKEEGCAIVDAVKSGEIARSRHDSYVMLYEILRNKHKWDK